jgi:hypothetical protein
MTRGRKIGGKNRPGHRAGGRRKNSGRNPKQDSSVENTTVNRIGQQNPQEHLHSLASIDVEQKSNCTIQINPHHPSQTNSHQSSQMNLHQPSQISHNLLRNLHQPASQISSQHPSHPSDTLPRNASNPMDLSGVSSDEEDEDQQSDREKENDEEEEDNEHSSFWKSEGPIQSYLKLKYEEIQKSEVRKKIFDSGQVIIRAPEPILTMKTVHPDHFFRPDIFLWFPEEYPNGSPICCPHCDSLDVRHHSWPKNPGRKVYSINRFFILISRRMLCRACTKTFMSHDADVLKKLPAYLQYLFPAILTKRGGVSVELLRLVNSIAGNGLGFSNVHEVIDELQHLEYDISQIKYYDLCTKKIEEKRKKQDGISALFPSIQNISDPVADFSPPKFGKFSNLKGYAGMIPSANYLQKLFIQHHKTVRPWMDSKVSDIKSEILKIDHTFSLPEYIGLGSGEKLFHALFTAMNEYGEIRLQFLAPTKGFIQLEGVFEKFRNTCIERSYSLPRIIYTDNCCGDRRWISKAALDVQIINETNLETYKIPDNIKPQVIAVFSAFEDICEVLLEEKIDKLAIDAEWNYSEYCGPEKLAILQLTDGKSIWIVQIHKFRKIPDALLRIISNCAIKKIGRNIHSDILKLLRDWKERDASEERQQITGIVDLAAFAKQKGKADKANCALEELAESILKRSLDKSLRHSNWEQNELSDELISYAAADVFCSYQIFEVLDQVQEVKRLKDRPDSGTSVSIMCITGNDAVVAIGTIISKEEANYRGKLKLTKHRAFVRIDRVFAESAIVGVERITLSQIQCLPYATIFDLWQLSTTASHEAPTYPLPNSTERIQTSSVSCDCDGDEAETEAEEKEDSSLDRINNIAAEDNSIYNQPILNPIFEEISNNSGGLNHHEPEFQENPPQLQQAVLQDVFHLMRRMQIKAHPLRSAFFKCFREAIFLLDKNDFENVKAVLDTSFSYNIDLWSSYCQSRIRRYIPEPKVLYSRVKKVLDHFKTFIKEMGMEKNAKKILMHIEKGCLSDPKGLKLYKFERKDSEGLAIYTCSRGTNSVESLHQKLVRQFACYHASAELGDSLLAEQRHRHNSRAGIRNRGYFDCHHYCQYLTEHIQMLYGSPTIKNWPSSSNWTSTKEQFGIIPLFSEKQSSDPKLKGQYKFLAEKMGTRLPYVPIHTKEEASFFINCLKQDLWKIKRLKMLLFEKIRIKEKANKLKILQIQKTLILLLSTMSLWRLISTRIQIISQH